MDFNAMLSNLKRKADSAAAAAVSEGTEKRTKVDNVPKALFEKQDKKIDFRKPFPDKVVEQIFLVCPPNVQTGGPEAMHQLCNEINSFAESSDSKVSAFMLYIEDRGGRACYERNAMPLDAYHIYKHIKVCTDWDEKRQQRILQKNADGADFEYSSSLVIWPECWTNLIDTLEGNHQSAIWWLSVDNNNSKFQQWERRDILHLHQSEYAKQHIMKNLKKATSIAAKDFGKKQVLPMTEYIPKRHNPEDFENLPRDLEILYNPLKGIHYTDAIRKRSDKKFRFTPIGGAGKNRITPSQVTKLLHRANVYIDFGPHPGMDRLPREAAIANCIVITNKEGAAFYDQDVPIPSKNKIGKFNVEEIHQLLKVSIDEYEDKNKNFDSYRAWISNQKVQMEVCVKGLVHSIGIERHSN
jgi:hypothetical protein